MPSFLPFSLALLSSFVLEVLGDHQVLGGWSLATPGGPSDIIITAENTLNSTSLRNFVGGARFPRHAPAISRRQSGSLAINLVNNYNGAVNAYITAKDPNNAFVMLGPDSQWFYPQADPSAGDQNTAIDASKITIPLNGQGAGALSVTLPTYVTSARAWFAVGDLQFFVNGANGVANLVQPSAANPSDPSAGIFWGFAEFTNTQDGGLYINPSQVDFAAIPVGVTVDDPNGGPQKSTPGMAANAVSNICSSLNDKSNSEPQPWNRLCVADSNGNLVRALSPNTYRSPAWNSTAFDGYFEPSIDTSYTAWTTQTSPLMVDTQSFGNVTCMVTNDQLQCDQDDTPIAKFSSGNIFACDGGSLANAGSDIQKAIVARICAGFTRNSIFYANPYYLTPADGAGPSTYYSASPCSWYSKFIHDQISDQRGYAFPYDDVTPNAGGSQDGTLTMNPAGLVTLTVGGY